MNVSGNLGPSANYFRIPGTTGGTENTWSYESPQLPVGTYDVFLRIRDDLGNLGTDSTRIFVGPIGDDLPSATINAAERYQQAATSFTATFGGTASDDNQVDSVMVTIYDSVERGWVQPDGSIGFIAAPFSAALSTAADGSITWSYSFTAPRASTYGFFVRAVDSAGQSSAESLSGSLRLYPGDARPTVTITLPSDNQVLTNNRIAVAGSANDDNSVSAIELLIRNADTGEYLRTDGSFGAAQWIPGSLTNPGGSRSNFDYQTGILPDGTWDVLVRSRDNHGQSTSPIPRVRVTLE